MDEVSRSSISQLERDLNNLITINRPTADPNPNPNPNLDSGNIPTYTSAFNPNVGYASTSTTSNVGNTTDVTMKEEPVTPTPAPRSHSGIPPKNVSAQHNTWGMLYNLQGLQSINNTKLDNLTDSISRLTLVMNSIHEEQKKHTELLANIVRNTLNSGHNTPTSMVPHVSKGSKMTVKDYGFTNPVDVCGELLCEAVRLVETVAKSKGKQYRSNRPFNRTIVAPAIKVACSQCFKDPSDLIAAGPIKLPENKDPATIKIASRIGKIGEHKSVLTLESIGELFDDPECRTFISAFEYIVERLKVIRIILPFCEADIINAMQQPYFSADGSVGCNWSLLVPRSETQDEAAAVLLLTKKKELLGNLIAQGVKFKTAMKTVTLT